MSDDDGKLVAVIADADGVREVDGVEFGTVATEHGPARAAFFPVLPGGELLTMKRVVSS